MVKLQVDFAKSAKNLAHIYPNHRFFILAIAQIINPADTSPLPITAVSELKLSTEASTDQQAGNDPIVGSVIMARASVCSPALQRAGMACRDPADARHFFPHKLRNGAQILLPI